MVGLVCGWLTVVWFVKVNMARQLCGKRPIRTSTQAIWPMLKGLGFPSPPCLLAASACWSKLLTLMGRTSRRGASPLSPCTTSYPCMLPVACFPSMSWSALRLPLVLCWRSTSVRLRFLCCLLCQHASGELPLLFEVSCFQLLELGFSNFHGLLDVFVEGLVVHLDVWVLGLS